MSQSFRVKSFPSKRMKKKEADVVVFVEGGIVQAVLRPNARRNEGYKSIDHEIVDYDVFQNIDGDAADMWNAFSPELQAYFKKHLKNEYRKFQEAVRFRDNLDKEIA